MSSPYALDNQYPRLAKKIGREPLAHLPAPVRHADLRIDGISRRIAIKCDDNIAPLYGGNKVRKLEFLLWPARVKNRRCIATFGAVGSNHALATALHARALGYECACFLVHQPASPAVRDTLMTHLRIGSKIIRYGGGRPKRVATLRKHLRGRRALVIPAGGSSWLGTLGFVNAGLELAAQISNAELEMPDRVYIAAGTLGSAAGLAVGFALAGLDTAVQAVRVSMPHIANDMLLNRLIEKTVEMMRRLDDSIPADTAGRVCIEMRHEFFADGYARQDDATVEAIQVAREQLGLHLEGTYTGKAMAAMLHDLSNGADNKCLFWNSYNSVAQPPPGDIDPELLPDEFRRYLD